MTSVLVVIVVAFLLLAQAVTLPNWLLFSVSLVLITLFLIYGRDRTNVRNH
jgi:hypothetical protein